MRFISLCSILRSQFVNFLKESIIEFCTCVRITLSFGSNYTLTCTCMYIHEQVSLEA